MRLKLLATALLAAANMASAAPVPVTLFGGPVNYTATIGKTHFSAGSFVDEFFINADGLALVNGQLSAVFQPDRMGMNQIVFNDVEADETDFMLATAYAPGVVIHIALWAPTVVDGGFLLRVEGCAGACDGSPVAQSGIAASYSGTLNLHRVDAPPSLPLALAALGAASLALRRRGAQTAAA